jgi:peroxidase
VDATLDQTLAKNLKATCPSESSSNTANLDLRTPTVFDNKYYLDLMNKQGLFTSDQDLNIDSRTKELVNDFAVNQNLFFEKFANAFIKVSQLNVTVGNQGEIRAKCNVVNGAKKSVLKTLVEEGMELMDQF